MIIHSLRNDSSFVFTLFLFNGFSRVYFFFYCCKVHSHVSSHIVYMYFSLYVVLYWLQYTDMHALLPFLNNKLIRHKSWEPCCCRNGNPRNQIPRWHQISTLRFLTLHLILLHLLLRRAIRSRPFLHLIRCWLRILLVLTLCFLRILRNSEILLPCPQTKVIMDPCTLVTLNIQRRIQTFKWWDLLVIPWNTC